MRVVRHLSILALAVVSFVSPRGAASQGATAQKLFGVYLGGEYDNEDNWFLLGAEARLPLATRSAIINPRLTYHPFDGGWVMQADVNALWHLQLPQSTKVTPYMGLGLALIHDKFGDFSETNVGYNIISGMRFNLMESTLRPFLHAQYTATVDYPNTFALVAGLLFILGG